MSDKGEHNIGMEVGGVSSVAKVRMETKKGTENDNEENGKCWVGPRRLV